MRYRIFDSQPTEENLLATNRHGLHEERRIIRKDKRYSWRSVMSIANRLTPLHKVWSIIKLLENKLPYISVTTLQVENAIFDDPLDVANILVISFSHISSSPNYDQSFQDH